MKNTTIALGAFMLISITDSGVYAQERTRINVMTNSPKEIISKDIYGHFAEHLGRCIYDGFWVDESMPVAKDDRIRLDIVEALKKINIPNLRWPGGCFADEYQWSDGIGPREKRPVTLNSHWGGVTEDNSFGTDEFLKLCSLLECEPYISANVGSGTPEQMRDWIEYLNYEGETTLTRKRKENGRNEPWKVSFWGVGNESWGCGGDMTPEYYADQFRRYQSYARNYSGNPIRKIACGPNNNDYNWMEVCMKRIPAYMMWGISLHYYTIPTGNWGNKGSATEFGEQEYFKTMQNCLVMDELLQKHTAIMDKYDPKRNVALCVDEWGIWTDVEPGTNPGFLYQQNSLRDALIAATTLNLFNNYSHRVRMANLAQTINVLQALILTDGPKMILTPTYHVFDLYKDHQNARYLPVQMSKKEYRNGNEALPAINASASVREDGTVLLTLVNISSTDAIPVDITLDEGKMGRVSGEVLSASSFTAHNTFEKPHAVEPTKLTGVKVKDGVLSAVLPALSVVAIEVSK